MSERFPRPISTDEADVVRAALIKAAEGDAGAALIGSVDRLVVIGRCKCGCASVDFECPGGHRTGALLAHGMARTSKGFQVGVLVWGDERGIRGLEIFELDMDVEANKELPVPDTIEPWRPERGAT